MSAAATGLASWPWSMIGVLFSVTTWPITLLVIIFLNRRPERRVNKLKKPVDAHFVVPHIQYHACAYARQNEHEHLLKTLVLPSDSDLVVDMCMKSHVHFETSQIYLGCYENPLDKPQPYEICNRFITTGRKRHVIPGDGNDDYLDKYGYYHFVEKISWSKNMDKVFGFKFKTGHPGIFTLRVYFNGDEIEPFVEGLKIIVEDEPHTRMFCVVKEHAGWNCAVGLEPRPR